MYIWNIFGEENPSIWAKETTEKSFKTIIALIVPEGTDGASEFKPMRHRGKLHDDVGYYSSRDGRILSISKGKKNRKPLILSPKRAQAPDHNSPNSGYIRPSAVNTPNRLAPVALVLNFATLS